MELDDEIHLYGTIICLCAAENKKIRQGATN